MIDATIEYLWAAGYGLPPEAPSIDVKPAPPVIRRGKKAARSKREKAAQ